METGEIVLAILTFAAILVALGIGIASILHTRSMQKRERRERLLNEIIEWAIDICRCGLKPFGMPTKEKSGSLYLLEGLGDLLLEYESISGRTEYIKRIAARFGKDLKDAVGSLAITVEARTKLIDEQIDILNDKKVEAANAEELIQTEVFKEWLSSKSWAKNWPKYLSESFKINIFKMEMNRTILSEGAEQVIEEATRLKTRDIS